MGIILSKFHQAAEQVNNDTAEVSILAESANRNVDVHNPFLFGVKPFWPGVTKLGFVAVTESDRELTVHTASLSFRWHFKCSVLTRLVSFLMNVNNFEKLSHVGQLNSG